jgi:predicted Ser/Thr protein kinase
MSDPLERYQLIRLLGRGGMGEVYLARRTADGVSAALKIARGQLGEQGRLRLEREAELLSRVESVNLPSFLEAFESRGRLVLAMEFVVGEPLQLHVAEPGEPSERLALVKRSLPGLARGLRALHQLGIVHRDVKPANVVLAEDRCVLVDLGLARGPDVETLTKTGLSVGTPEYLPPEQVSAEVVTGSADLYQVALVARDLLAGSRRRPGFDAVQDAIERAVRPPPDLSRELPWVPGPLSEWIRRALHPDPAARPEADAHLAALEVVLRDMPAAPAIPVTDSARPTWMETEDFAEVAKARDTARRTGWTEARAAPPPKPRTAKPAPAPASAPPVAAPPTRTAGAGLAGAVLGAVVALGGALAFLGGGPSAGIPPGEWVFGLEDDRLVLLEGRGEFRLTAPERRPFTRGTKGRLGVEFAGLGTGEPVEVQVGLGEEVRTLRLPGRTSGLPGARLFGDDLRLALPWTVGEPTEVRLRAGDGLWAGRVSGPVVLEGSAAFLDHPVWSGSMELGPRVRLEFEVDLRAAMEAQLAEVRPPEVGLDRMRDVWSSLAPNSYPAGTLYPPPAARWLQEEGPAVRAALRARGVSLDERMRVYQALTPMLHLEWMWARDAALHGWMASRLLPPDLAISSGAFPLVDPERFVAHRKLYNLSLRMGGTAAIKEVMGNLEHRGDLSIRRDGDGVHWVNLTGLPSGPLAAVDLLTQSVGMEKWSRLEIHVGGRVLRLPLGQARLWRTHGIPLEVLEAARLGDGAVEVGFRLDRDRDLQNPSNGNLVLVGLRLLQRRESK